MKTFLIAAALVALPGAASAQAMTGTQYVTKAGASDQYEIQSSRLLLTSTRDPGLKRFATEMVSDHVKSTADVKRAATAARVKAGPPHLDATGRRNMAALRAARGPARDRLYVAQQKKSHQMALMVQQGYATHGRVAPLQAAATKIVPVVQHHIGELARM